MFTMFTNLTTLQIVLLGIIGASAIASLVFMIMFIVEITIEPLLLQKLLLYQVLHAEIQQFDIRFHLLQMLHRF